MNATIFVQAVFHRANRYKLSICKTLKERGWVEHKLAGRSFVWKGDSNKFNCSQPRDLELKAEQDFFTCAVIHGVKMTIVYEVKRKRKRSEN